MQIDKFCIKKENLEKQRYEKYKKSNLTVESYIKKYKIKDKPKFKKIVQKYKKIENDTIDPSQNQPKKCVVKDYEKVKENVFKEFVNKRSLGQAVTYNELKRASFKEARELNLKKRCDSINFINSLKKKYRIVSRRIQEKRNLNKKTEETLLKNAESFVEKINQILPRYNPENVFNSDQTGINYEITTYENFRD